MRRLMAIVAMLGATAASLCSLSLPAAADTLPFASGVDSNTGNCFEWSEAAGSVGLVRHAIGGSCNNHYYMPLYWRNFEGAGVNREITIRGRRATASSEISCSVFVYDAAGNIIAQDGAFFTEFGSDYSSITLSVNNIVSSGTSFIACSMTAGDAWLLSATWSP